VGDVASVRARWPEILELVKAQSKVAWTMISANANVVGLDGRLLQIGFNSAGLRDSFAGSNREETLRGVLRQIFGGEWRIDALVDPTAGQGQSPNQGGGGFGSGPAYPAAGQASGGFGAGSQNPAPPQAAAPAPPSAPPAAPEARFDGPGAPPTHPPPAQAAPAASHAVSTAALAAPAPNAFHSTAVSPAAATANVTQPPPSVPPPSFAPASGPFDDDEDAFEAGLVRMDDRAVSGQPATVRDLLVRELGANLLEEIQDTD
jgi:DNA polymerase-3 subunit gamma/tau